MTHQTAERDARVIEYTVAVRRLLDAKQGHAALLRSFFDGRSAEGLRLGAKALIDILRRGDLSQEVRLDAFDALYDVIKDDPNAKPVIVDLLRDICASILSIDHLRKHPHLNNRDVDWIRQILEQYEKHGGDPALANVMEPLAHLLVSGYRQTTYVLRTLACSGIAGPVPSQLARQDWEVELNRNLYERAITIAISQRAFGTAAALSCALDPTDSRSFDLMQMAHAYDDPISLLHAVGFFRPYSDSTLFHRRHAINVDALSHELFASREEAETMLQPTPRFDRHLEPCPGHCENEGEITLLPQDQARHRIVDRLLSRGRWIEAHDVMFTLTRSWRSCLTDHLDQEMRDLVLPAMFAARRAGQIGVAAAFGQIALAEYRQYRQGSSSGSLIVDGVLHCTNAHLHHQYSELRAEERQIRGWSEHPTTKYDGYASHVECTKMDFDRPRPPELQKKFETYERTRMLYAATLTRTTLDVITNLLDCAIKNRIPFTLDIF